MSFPRFWVKVNKNGPIPHDTNLGQCWQWTAGTDADGYGRFGFRQGDHYINKKAHRVAWFLVTGRWPSEYLLHRCDNTLCIRPDHCYEGTQQDNVRDREERQRRNVTYVRNRLGQFVDVRAVGH